jgi:hypothetical protein
LMQHLLYVLHAFRDAVGHGGWDGGLVVSINEPSLFQGFRASSPRNSWKAGTSKIPQER